MSEIKTGRARAALKSLYADPDRVVITAHRGYSGAWPENTMRAFTAAVEAGAHIVEFDLRGTRERIPIVLHDDTLSRTANDRAYARERTLSEIRRLNASYWEGPHDLGRKLSRPALPDAPIPTFEEVAGELGQLVGMNIQLYESDSPFIEEVCRLFARYDLYERAYLSVGTYREARRIRNIDSDIELCVLEQQGAMNEKALEDQHAFGALFVQPLRSDVDEAFCRRAHALGLAANMFYANTDEDNRHFLSLGIRGILTDFPELLASSARALGLKT